MGSKGQEEISCFPYSIESYSCEEMVEKTAVVVIVSNGNHFLSAGNRVNCLAQKINSGDAANAAKEEEESSKDGGGGGVINRGTCAFDVLSALFYLGQSWHVY
ncbi:uncharacterized protein LOC134744786 [Cydia strobilella]|uniref:uncharacterized protein LOC134744786 n=1 Tax=Cydia strobilella TaxID=1100964 RepID=UPI0030078AFA